MTKDISHLVEGSSSVKSQAWTRYKLVVRLMVAVLQDESSMRSSFQNNVEPQEDKGTVYSRSAQKDDFLSTVLYEHPW